MIIALRANRFYFMPVKHHSNVSGHNVIRIIQVLITFAFSIKLSSVNIDG